MGLQNAAELFGQRLQLLREKRGLRKTELAERIGVSLTTIQQYENGQMPKGEFAVRLGRVLHCSLDWLLAGADTQSLHHAQSVQEENIELSTLPLDAEDRLVMVPMMEARLSAGGGSFETSSELLRHYAFRWDFLHRKGTPSQMVLLRVTGDSMQPHILNNDVVLIDQSQNIPNPGQIYAVSVEDMVYLKVIDALPGKLLLSSINPEYAPIEVPVCEHTQDLVRIIGRAVWVGRELV